MIRVKGQRGLSLVEVTIMLLVLMLLTSVLAPSIFDFVIDAQWVKVKEDCEAIGISVARLTRDVGPCLKMNAQDTSGCSEENRADLLYSDGPQVTDDDVVPSDFTSNNLQYDAINWYYTLKADPMGDQFVTNLANYNTPTEKAALGSWAGGFPVGPLFGLGWRGAYLAPPIGPDPWGGRYMVNSVFLAAANNATTANSGAKGMWWDEDVICLSAGPDRLIQTPIGGNANYGTARAGDDWTFVIQGAGR